MRRTWILMTLALAFSTSAIAQQTANTTFTGNTTVEAPTAATATANQNSPTLCIDGNYWTGVASAADSWCWQDVLETGSNPPTTFTLTHSGSGGTAIVALPALTATSIGATMPGTGNFTTVTANSVRPKGTPWYSVTCSGGDDTATIQDAVNAQTSGVVFIADGACGIGSGGISLANKVNFTLQCSKNTNLDALAGLGANPVIHISGSSTSNVKVDGCIVNGESIADVGIYVDAGGSSITISHNDIGHNASGGSFTPGGIGIRGSYRSGVVPTNVTIFGNHIHDIASGHGIYNLYTIGANIVGNIVDGNALGFTALFASGTGTVVTNNVVTMTHGSSFNDRGIGSFAAYNFTVSNNFVKGTPGLHLTDGDMIYFDTGINGSISNNTVLGYGSHATGILCEVCRNVSISGNNVSDVHGVGIKSLGRADDFQINALDATTALTFATNVTGSIDASDKQEGTGSLKTVIASGFTTGTIFSQNFASATDLTQPPVQDHAGRSLVDLWLKADTNITPGILQLQMSSTAGLANPTVEYSIPFLLAGTWVHVRLDAPEWYDKMTSITSWGIVALSDPGAITLHFDDLRADTTREEIDVAGNTVRRSGLYGIQLSGVNDSSINGNTLADCGWNGLTTTSSACIRVDSLGEGRTPATSNIDVIGNTLRNHSRYAEFQYGVIVAQSNGGTLDSVRAIANDAQGFNTGLGIASVGTVSHFASTLNYTLADGNVLLGQPVKIGNDTATLSNAPHMTMSCVDNSPKTISAHCKITLDKGITVTRLMSRQNAFNLSGCSTQPVLRVTNGTNNVDLRLTNGAADWDTGPISTPFAAGTTVTFTTVTPGVACTNLSVQNMMLEYTMQ